MSVEKDKSEPRALGSKAAGKTVVGVPAIPPDSPSDAALTKELPPLDDELPTAHDMKAVSATDADRVLSERPPGVAGAVSPRSPAAGIKTPPLSGDLFRGLPRPAALSMETETKTRAGVAPQPGVAPRGRSTLLLDGSAPPVLSDAHGEGPPIVVPVSGAMPPKAVTQPPPWGEGAAHATAIPRMTAPMRAREPSAEEISASMLLPADPSGDFASPATEELSGSLLVEDGPGPGSPAEIVKPPHPGSVPPKRAPSVKPPVPQSSRPPPVQSSRPPPVPSAPPSPPASARPPSVKPPVPKSTSTRPAAHAHRTLLGMPELPTATPGPNLDALPKLGSAPPPIPATFPPIAPPVGDQPAVILAASLIAEMQPPPPVATFPPAPVPDFVANPPSPGGTAPLPAQSAAPAPAPFTGDVELTRLPRSGVDRAVDEARRLGQRLLSRLPEQSLLRSGSRPPWFLPAVAAAGLIVGIGLVGLLVSVLRGGSRDDRGNSAGSARASATASSPSNPSNPSALAAPVTSAAMPAPLPASGLAPCTVSGTSHVLGPSAIVAAGVEVAVGGSDVAVGFAPDDHDAIAMRVDPSQVTVGTTARAKSKDPVRRVTPLLSKGALSLIVDTDHKGDKLQGRRALRANPPVQLGATSDGQLAWARLGGGPAGPLWPLGGSGGIDAVRGTTDGSGDPTIALAFRSGGAVWTGTVGGTGGLAPVGPLSHIDGLGTAIGSPAVAISSSVVFLAWADRASNDAPWKLRWTHFAAGSAPDAPTDFVPPDGGKGEPFMSPALATVPGGRVLLLWTEGPASGHVVRAQTLALDGTRLGAPLELSPDGANAGQAQAAITDAGSGVVAFLESSAKGFQVAATAIHCGTP